MVGHQKSDLFFTCLRLGSFGQRFIYKYLTSKIITLLTSKREVREGIKSNIGYTNEQLPLWAIGIQSLGTSERPYRIPLRVVPPKGKETVVFIHQLPGIIDWGMPSGMFPQAVSSQSHTKAKPSLFPAKVLRQRAASICNRKSSTCIGRVRARQTQVVIWQCVLQSTLVIRFMIQIKLLSLHSYHRYSKLVTSHGKKKKKKRRGGGWS